MKVWFFGDSTTFGHGLKPGFEYYDKFPQNRSKTWIRLLTEYFQGEEVNYSFCGASNEDIKFRLATNLYKFDKKDVVVIQSTYSGRTNLFDNKNLFRPIHFAVENETLNLDDFSPDQIKSFREFVKFNLIDHIERYEIRDIIFYLSIKRDLEQKGIRTIFWHHSVLDKKFREMQGWSNIEQESGGVVKDNFHLGFSSQKSFFKFLKDNYEKGLTSIIPSSPFGGYTNENDLLTNLQKIDRVIDTLYRDMRGILLSKYYDESYLFYSYKQL